MDILGYIYKITNKYTKKYYIGKTKNLPFGRWSQHLNKIFTKENLDQYLFEVVEVVYKTNVDWKDRNLLSLRERSIILSYPKSYRAKYCLNDTVNLNDLLKRWSQESALSQHKLVPVHI